jgi:hypothetical protein
MSDDMTPMRSERTHASCTTDETPLQRRLYAMNDDTKGAA